MFLEYKHLRDLPERSWTQVTLDKFTIWQKRREYTSQIHLPKASKWIPLSVPFPWHPFEQATKPTSSVSSSGSGSESYPTKSTQTWFMGSKAQPKLEKKCNSRLILNPTLMLHLVRCLQSPFLVCGTCVAFRHHPQYLSKDWNMS